MKIIVTFAFVLSTYSCLSQVSTFSGNGKTTHVKLDSSVKKDSSFSERSMPRTFTRKGVSDLPYKKEDFANVVYVHNGKRITMAQADSITKNWEGVKCVDDISKRPIERTISPLTKDEFTKAQVGQKNGVVKKWSGEKMPAYSFTDIEGTTYSHEQLKGKIVVLNFWFISCVPCLKEMPELNKLVEKYKNNPEIAFLGLALDSESEIKEFLKKKKFNYKLIGHTGKFTRETMGIEVWPTSMVIDKKGTVQLSFSGNDEAEIKRLEKKIEILIQK